jgi:hypothetical protein
MKTIFIIETFSNYGMWERITDVSCETQEQAEDLAFNLEEFFCWENLRVSKIEGDA